jgi:hypothetical protein
MLQETEVVGSQESTKSVEALMGLEPLTPVLSAGPMEPGGIWKTNFLNLDPETGNILYFSMESKYGKLVFGKFSDRHQGWRWFETGGGGSVTLLHSLHPNKGLLVSLLQEERLNMGPERQWCAAGGFKNPTETHADTQSREAAQEIGVDTTKANALPGLPVNLNRNYFGADVTADEGVHLFEYSIPFELLQESDGGLYSLTVEVMASEKQHNLLFWPWEDAVMITPDACALSAIVRLLASLKQKGDLGFYL